MTNPGEDRVLREHSVATGSRARGTLRYHDGQWYRSGSSRPIVSPADARRMSDSAWTVTSRLIAGVVLYAGVGWLMSIWLGHRDLLIAAGALVGIGLAMFTIVRGLMSEGERDSGK